MGRPRPSPAPAPGRRRPWKGSPERAELLALYAEADRLVAGWTCACSASEPADALRARCCHFGVTGREPYPTAAELEEVRHGMRTAAVAPRPVRALPLVDARPCPLLSAAGRCLIYESRPLGCRTFFCDGAEAPFGAKARAARGELQALGRRIADLSARFAPRDPHPRPLSRALMARTRTRT